MREAGVSVRDCASYAAVSEATAMRALANLRKLLGPEKFTGTQARHARQRARAHLFLNSAQHASSPSDSSQIASTETN